MIVEKRLLDHHLYHFPLVSGAGWRDGQSQALVDERSGIDNAECGTEHSNPYCTGFIAGYTAEHAPFNILHPK